MKKVFLAALVWVLAAGCGKKGQSYRISAPDTIEPSKSATVAVSGSFDPGVKILWATTGGHIEGANNGLTATFVAPEKGSVTLLCTIAVPGQNTIALEKQVVIGGSAAAGNGESTPSAAAAPPAPPNVGVTAPIEIENAGFIPSGWMGDIAGLKVDPNSLENPHSPPKCQKWSYLPSSGGGGWAAVAWQFPENNWGDKPGRDWSGRGIRQISVWARGVRDSAGILPKLQFKAGGATSPGKPYQASFEVQGDFVTLTEKWHQYTLDLSGQKLNQVIAAFLVVVRAQDVGPKGTTFYLDDIEYQ